MYTDVVFEYYASRKLLKEEAIRGGKAGSDKRALRVPLGDLTPEQREALIPICAIQSSRGVFYANLLERKESREVASPMSPSATWETCKVYLDADPTVAEAVEMAVTFANASREAEDRGKTLYEAHQAHKELEKEEQKAVQAAEDAAYESAVAALEPLLAGSNIAALRAFSLHRAAGWRREGILENKIVYRILELEREAAEAPMREWIAAHGSPRLQKALAAGADVERPYIKERVAAELPGFRVDWGNDATLDTGYPSEDALDEAEVLRDQDHNAEARILTSWPDEDGYDQYDQYNDGEAHAVVIWYVYGGKHHAIKVLD